MTGGFSPSPCHLLPWHPALNHWGCLNRQTLIYRVNHYEMEEINDYHWHWFDLMEPHSKLLIFFLSHCIFFFLWENQIKIYTFVQLATYIARYVVCWWYLLLMNPTHLLPAASPAGDRISSLRFQRRLGNLKIGRRHIYCSLLHCPFPFFWEKAAFGSLEWKLAVHFLMAAKSRLPSGWCRCHCFDFIQVVTQQTLLCLII